MTVTWMCLNLIIKPLPIIKFYGINLSQKLKLVLKIYRKYMVGKKACNHFYFYLMSQIKIKNISLPTFYSAPSQLEGFSVNLAFLQ